ncbi:MAG: hypothetical protein K8F91_04940 [Candidatus Obscuribacterales bacterium]|nr:hypothetical protein [Candidatus Obscuribacterales bacterium]
MNIAPPPRVVPLDLTPAEYLKLAVRYLLMGWTINALKASRKGLLSEQEELAGTPLSEMTRSDYRRFRALIEGLDNSVLFWQQVVLVSSSLIESVQEAVDNADLLLSKKEKDVFRLFKFGFEESLRGLSHEVSNLAIRAFEAVLKLAQPNREVESNLSARQYLDLSRRYLKLGWSEQARDALVNVLETYPASSEARRARVLVNSHLPREPVPYLAAKAFIASRHAQMLGPLCQATALLEKLVEDYPSFESPYCRLADIYISKGRLCQAKDLAGRSLAINENYLAGWILTARLQAIAGQVLESQRSLDRASQLDSEDGSVAYLRQLVSMLSRL